MVATVVVLLLAAEVVSKKSAREVAVRTEGWGVVETELVELDLGRSGV